MRTLYSVCLLLASFWALGVIAAQKASDFLSKPAEWYRSEEASKIAGNILTFQTDHGDFPKNTDTVSSPYTGDRAALKGIFDNNATIPELKFLAKVFNATKDAKLEAAFLKGFDHILKAQYTNGGWPQAYPPGKGYDRHITFNDETMVNIMNFVREVSTKRDYDFAGIDRQKAAAAAFEKGVDCILKCQIRIDGKLTAWCAQHDEVDFSPRPARTYELASLSGSESAGIVRLLMSIEKPSPEIMAAVDAAVAWFEAVKLTGIRETRVQDPKGPKGWDKRVVADPTAPALWARFYDLKTLKPMFVDRDGIPKSNIADIGYERRNGYGWHVISPQSVLNAYPNWKKKHANQSP
jgi:PelA/Pel-15E family pectate lyase